MHKRKPAQEKAFKAAFERSKEDLRALVKRFDALWKKGKLLELSELCDDVAVGCRKLLALDYMIRKRIYKEDRQLISWIVCGDPLRHVRREKERAAQSPVPSPKKRRA